MTIQQARIFAGLMVLGWAALQYAVARGTLDASWREADTQTIALNFLNGGFNLFYPQVAWGGNGPGYVESELQIYPMLVALVMKMSGEAEWPGQLISLIATCYAAMVLHKMVTRHYGSIAGVASTIFLLTTPLMMQLSVRVMPDALAFMALVVGFDAFDRWRSDPKPRLLILMTVSLAAAALIKPFMLAIGFGQFLILVAFHRDKLFAAGFWIGWCVIAGLVGLSMWHGLQLYQTYGNSFGVLSGIDSKFPDLEHALRVGIYRQYVETSLRSGTLPALLAAGYLLVRRKMDWIALFLTIAAAIALFISMRYSSTHFAGLHYHTIMLLPAAFFVAAAIQDLVTLGRQRIAMLGLVLLCAATYGVSLWNIRTDQTDPTIPTKKSQTFSTADDNQSAVTIRVSQGEREMAADNKLLGQFDLVGIPPAPRGIPQIEVTFDIDANGIVNVTAKDKATEKEQQIRIQASGGLSDDEVDSMVKDAEAHAEEDKKRKEMVEARNHAEALIHSTEQTLSEHGDKISESDKSTIEAAVEDLKTALEGDDAEEVTAKTQALTEAAMKLGEAMYQAQQSDAEAAAAADAAADAADNPGGPEDVVDADFEEVSDDDDQKKSA